MWNSDTISLQQTNTSLSTFNSLTSDIQKPAEPQAAAQDGEAGSNTAKSSNNARVAATSRSDLNVGTGAAAERRKKRVSQSLSNKSYALKEDAETAAAEEADDNLLNAVCKNSLTTAPSFLLPQLFLSLTSVLCITTVEFIPFIAPLSIMCLTASPRSIDLSCLILLFAHTQVSADILEAHAALGPSASDLILPSSRKRNKSDGEARTKVPALSAAEVKEAEFISKKQRRKLARCEFIFVNNNWQFCQV